MICATGGGCAPSHTPAQVCGASATDCPAPKDLLHVAPDIIVLPQGEDPAADPQSLPEGPYEVSVELGVSWTTSQRAVNSTKSLASSINKSISRIIATMLTQPSFEPGQPHLQGFVLQENTEEHMMNSSRNLTKLATVLSVSKRYPAHCLNEVRHCIFPLLGALLVTVPTGFILRVQAAALGDDFDGTLWEVYTSSELPVLIGTLDCPVNAIIYMGWFGSIASAVGTFWSLKAVTPSLTRLLLPSFAFANLFWICVVVMRRMHMPYSLWMSGVVYLNIALGVVSTLFCVGRAVRNPVFGWAYSCMYFSLVF